MGRLLKYSFFLTLAVGIGCYVFGLFSLEDLLPTVGLEDLLPMLADRRPPALSTEPTPPASIDEELDYTVAQKLSSVAGWRAFLDAHPSGAYAQSARAEVARRLGVSTATKSAAPTDSGRNSGLSERLASLASSVQLATAKVEQFFLADDAPAAGNPAVVAQASPDKSEATQSGTPVSSAAEARVPATAAISHDALQDANLADNSERSSAPPAPTRDAAGTQLAALGPDEICQQDEARLARLRSAPTLDEAVRFANELGCEKLRPQVLGLLEGLAPIPSNDASTATLPGAQVESEIANPASPPVGAEVAPPASVEICKRDEERLARLGSNPSRDEALGFVKELGCEKLLPQLQSLLKSPDLDTSASANSPSSSNSLLDPVCTSEREALDRLRMEPSAEAAGLFWRDLKCEGLRPQVRLLMESLNATLDSVRSAAAPDEPKARGLPSNMPTAAGEDSASCQRETAELNHVRATPDFGDAKRFASAVTCNALRPQVARLLESFGE